MTLFDEVMVQRRRVKIMRGVQDWDPVMWIAIILEGLGDATKAMLNMELKDYRTELIEVAASALALALIKSEVDVATAVAVKQMRHAVVAQELVCDGLECVGQLPDPADGDDLREASTDAFEKLLTLALKRSVDLGHLSGSRTEAE